MMILLLSLRSGNLQETLGVCQVGKGDALVAGFTNIILHTEITSLISFLSGVGHSLILNTEDIHLQ